MALRRITAMRLFDGTRDSCTNITLQHSPISLMPAHNALVPSNAAKLTFHREFLTSPDSAGTGFFRRFLLRREINQATKVPVLFSVPVGDKLREKLRSINVPSDRLGLNRPVVPATTPEEGSLSGFSVQEARKILRTWQLETLRSKLKQIPESSISRSEFVQICVDTCSNQELGMELAKTLDESGSVIVLGNVVFLRPKQVARSMEKMMSQSMAIPNDPRRRELDEMEKEKAAIDRKAESLVRGELYCGLGFLIAQTLGFMRLTFWELSWDVMEPICFFVTSLHCALTYGFFLRTSTEPSFEGYFRRRFMVKQTKLMAIHNFNLERYNQLCHVFHRPAQQSVDFGHFQGRIVRGVS